MANLLPTNVTIITEITVCIIFTIIAFSYIYFTYKSTKPNSFLSVNKSKSWIYITISLVASLMGNWVIFLPPSYSSYFGIFGAFAYSLSSVIPIIIFMFLGPLILRNLSEIDIISTDYFKKRYGKIVQTILSLFSFLYMWVFLCSELTTITLTINSLSNSYISPTIAIIPVALTTLLYTSFSGLTVSIFTDQIQGIFVLFLGLIIIILAFFTNDIDQNFLQNIEFFPTGSLTAGFSLILTIYPSELLNQSSWQRILACKNNSDLKKTCGVTAIFVFVIIFTFGFMGILSNYLYPGEFTTTQLFGLISPLNNWVNIIVLIFAISLVSSSVDSLQNGIISLMGSYLIKKNLSMNWARVATIIVNIPAIVVASLELNIFNLFYTANLLCLTVAAPQLLSFFPYFTSLGAIFGFIFGFFSVPIVGWIYTKSFLDGILYFYPSDISHISYVIIGIVTPLISALATLIFSCLDRMFINTHKFNSESTKNSLSITNF